MRGFNEYKRIFELWEAGKNKLQIAKILGIPRPTVRDCIKRYRSLAELEYFMATGEQPEQSNGQSERTYVIPHLKSRTARYNDEALQQAVSESISSAQTLEKLGVRAAGGNYAYLKKRISELGLDTSHFRGMGWLKGQRNTTVRKRAIE